MSVVVENKIYWVKEATDLLYSFVNDEKFPVNEIKEAQNLSGVELEAAETSFCIDLRNKLIKKLKLNSEIEKYFKTFTTSKYCLANLILFNISGNYYTDTKSARKHILEAFYRFPLTDYPSFSHGDYAINFDHNKRQNITKSIQSGDWSNDEQLTLFALFNDFEAFLDPLLKLIDQTILLFKPYEEQMQSQTLKFQKYWETVFENESYLKIFAMFGVLIDQDREFEIKWIPSIIRPYGVSGTISDDVDRIIINSGILMRKEFLRRETNIGKQEILNALKVLSDSSKLEILLFIKDQAAYGNQIANKLKLTTSTISYHMEALSNAGLVTLNKKDNRVYYQLNKNYLKSLLTTLEDTLMK